MSRQYLERFFEETDKVDPEATFEVTVEGVWNLIPYGVVIEALLATSPAEQKSAAHVIRRIDFANGDVCHFLRHLGRGLALTRGADLRGA